MEKRELKLIKLEFINFKGAKDLVVDFNQEGPTDIYADNGKFKTTTADGLPFVLFGKNSGDETKFGVKTYDEKGVTIPHLDHSVKATFKINGVTEVFERSIVEKWEKPHGKIDRVYTGDKTVLKINNDPVPVGEFNKQIKIIIGEGLFKLLSNPLEFHRLSWDRRREALIQIAGELPKDTVILDSLMTVQNKGDYNGLISVLNKKTDIAVYKQSLKTKIKTLNTELDGIDPRIKEVNHGKPEVLKWDDLEVQINALIKEVAGIDEALLDESKKHKESTRKQIDLTKSIGEEKLKLQNLESELKIAANKAISANKIEVSRLNGLIETSEALILSKKESIDQKNKSIDALESEMVKLRQEFAVISAPKFEFTEDQGICSKCKQELSEDTVKKDRDTLEGDFNEDKANKIAGNQQNGKSKSAKVDLFKLEIGQAEEVMKEQGGLIDQYSVKIKDFDVEEKPVDFTKNKDHCDILTGIALREDQVKEVKPVTNEEEEAKKVEISTSLKALEDQFKGKADIVKADKRIETLKKNQTKLAQQIADLEREESAITSFEKAKMDILEDRVNGMFKLCRFRMFEPQKNGGEKPDCTTLVDGVPYSDLNTAKKINAGLDIINVLSKHYQIFVPVIIDNRESVSEILPMDSQVINLIKDSNYQTLTVK